MKNIIIYRDHLLPISETFVRDQGENLKRFIPYYVGSRAVSGLSLPSERSFTINNQTKSGWVKEALFKSLGYSPDMVDSINRLRPALLHAHFGYGGSLALPIIKKLDLPFVITFHGVDATTKDQFAKKSYSQWLYLRKRKELQSRGNFFIAISKFIKKKMLDQGYPDNKIIQHYIGINVDKFTSDPTVDRKNIVLFVARLVEVKGCKYLLEAIDLVQKKGTDVELIIIGDGPLRSELETLASKKIARYRFLGAQPQDEVRFWMNQAKIFCVPSVVSEAGNEEGFGLVFAEANAMGTPVVSFVSGGIPEAVSNGETALLVPEKDISALASSIIHLLEDELLWNTFSRQGITRVRTLFDIKKQSKTLEEIYDSLTLNSSTKSRVSGGDLNE